MTGIVPVPLSIAALCGKHLLSWSSGLSQEVARAGLQHDLRQTHSGDSHRSEVFRILRLPSGPSSLAATPSADALLADPLSEEAGHGQAANLAKYRMDLKKLRQDKEPIKEPQKTGADASKHWRRRYLPTVSCRRIRSGDADQNRNLGRDPALPEFSPDDNTSMHTEGGALRPRSWHRQLVE